MTSPPSGARWRRLARRRTLAALVGAAACLTLHALALAEPRRYTVQPETSDVSFKATSRLMNADGRFHRVTGRVTVDPADLASAQIALTIEAASIDTGIGLRDSHLRSADFLDAERFPSITFESTRVEPTGRNAVVTGRLTVRGVTRDVAVPVEVAISDVALAASGELVVNRRDYGMTYNSMFNPVGNEVRVTFSIRARAS